MSFSRSSRSSRSDDSESIPGIRPNAPSDAVTAAAAASTAASGARTGLSLPERRLGIRHGIAVCVGMVVGVGIFKAASNVAGAVDSEGLLLVLWLAGGILSLVGALCFAEMAGAFPDAGGDYHFLRLAYGERVGLLFAWSRFTVIHTGAMALMALVCGDYLATLIDLRPWLGEHAGSLFAATTILALTAVHFASGRLGTETQVGLVALVAFGLATVGGAGLWLAWTGGGGPQDAGFSSAISGASLDVVPHRDSAGIGEAMLFVFLAYGGWSDTATLSAELHDGHRGMFRALTAGLGLITALYLLVNWAFVEGLGLAGLASSQAPAADLMRRAAGIPGEFWIVSVVVATGISVMNATLIAGARTTYAAARDMPLLAKRLGTWDSVHSTPRGAVLAIGVLALALVGFGAMTRDGFATLVDFLSPVYWLFLTASGIALLVLRRRHPGVARPFRVPFYPWLPLLFAAGSAYALYSSVAYLKLGAVAGLIVLALGACLLFPGSGGTKERPCGKVEVDRPAATGGDEGPGSCHR